MFSMIYFLFYFGSSVLFDTVSIVSAIWVFVFLYLLSKNIAETSNTKAVKVKEPVLILKLLNGSSRAEVAAKNPNAYEFSLVPDFLLINIFAVWFIIEFVFGFTL
jgi:hypothetical protein